MVGTQEDLVLGLLKSTNRPYNVQLVADMLATKGVKKAAAEKILDSLVERGLVVRKEFGKTKIYFPSQDGLAALAPDQSVALHDRIKALTEACRAEDEAVAGLKRELAAASSALSVEELQAQLGKLEAAEAERGAKLAALKSGCVRRISASDVAKVEKLYTSLFEAWARYRRQFRAVWDTVSDGLEGKEEALFEEMGVDSDKMVGADFDGARALLQPVKKVRR